MAALLNNLMDKFDSLAARERILLWGVALLLMVLSWYSLLMEPVNIRHKNAIAQLNDSGISVSSDAAATDPDATLADVNASLQQIASLREQLQRTDQQLAAASLGLISPTQMNEAIHDLLQKQSTLTLVSLTSQPTRQLASSQAGDSDLSSDNSGVYLHPVQVTIDGDFTDILNYIRALEASHWRFDWQRFELNTTHYPVSRARIEISTLSLDQSLLGI